jgi:hypothetical protein
MCCFAAIAEIAHHSSDQSHNRELRELKRFCQFCRGHHFFCALSGNFGFQLDQGQTRQDF